MVAVLAVVRFRSTFPGCITLYSYIESIVPVKNFFMDPFCIECSVRQVCPFSPLLYVLAFRSWWLWEGISRIRKIGFGVCWRHHHLSIVGETIRDYEAVAEANINRLRYHQYTMKLWVRNNLSCDRSWKSFKKVFYETCNNIFCFVGKKHQGWFGDNGEEIGLILEEKRKAFNMLQNIEQDCG